MKEKLNHCLSRTTLRQLRAFAALIRSGSTKGAAQALHVTPPAITLQLRELEAAAGGLPLLERRPSGVYPTALGGEILEATERIEAILTDTAEIIEALKGLESGSVAVGVISTAKYFAPKALAAFSRDHPGIDMRITVGNRQDTIKALAGYDLDLAVMGRPPKEVAVDKAEIGDHPHVIIASPDHHLIGRSQVKLAELAGETFLLREPGSGTRSLIEDLFSKAGIDLSTGMEIGSNETIKQAVIAGLGIALISAHTIAAEVADGRLAVLDVKHLPIMRTWFLVKRADKRLSPAADALWTFLAANVQTFLP